MWQKALKEWPGGVSVVIYLCAGHMVGYLQCPE